MASPAEYIIQSEHTSGSTAKHYHGEAISTLNSWAANANNIPSNAIVDRITVYYSGKLSLGDTKFYVGYTNDSATEPGQKIISDQLTTSQKTWEENLSFSGRNINSGSYSRINVWMSSGIIYKKFTCYSFKIRYYYSIPNYTISANYNSTMGTVTGVGTYQNQATATITATPNSGYKFVGWANQSGVIISNANPYSFTVTNNTTLNAVFEPIQIYVIYDSLFSFKRWKETSLKSWVLMNILNTTDIGFTGQALSDDAYTEDSRPLISVEIGKNYILEVDVDTNVGYQLFVFYCNVDGSWGNLAYSINENKVYFTPTTNYISIRCDVDGTGNIGTFSNFRIYPSDCPYMSNSVSAEQRTNINSWNMPTPTRKGYKFLGWYTQPNGGGTKYTSSSSFPTSDLVLYSHWELQKYTVTFKNHDGDVLQTVSIEHGGTPRYTGSTPTKPSTDKYTYTFSGWDPPIGAITSDTTYTAQFTETIRKYIVSTKVTPSNSGTVKLFLEDGTEVTGQTNFEYGTYILVSSIPAEGYLYKGGTSEFIVRSNVEIESQFRKIKYKIYLSISPSEGGTVEGQLEYEYGDIVSLKAIPNTSYKFSQWQSPSLGRLENSILTYEVKGITEDTSISIRAYFTKKTYYFSVTSSPSNGGKAEINNDYIGYAVTYGEEVSLKATPNSGYKFVRWNEDLYSNPLIVKADDNAVLQYTAYFERLKPKFKSVKIYYPTGINEASPTNPLVVGQPAQIVVKIAME